MPVTLIAHTSLGEADFGWLHARYHFSFAGYHNPQRMGFGALRVINDDRVSAGTGFSPHGHRDMEIITYVRQGAITHEDSLGNKGRTEAGDVQVMSAGTGIQHSEFNRESIDTRLYQIWITPHTSGVTPRWDTRPFPKTPVTETLPLLVSGMPDHAATDALRIHQHAAIYGGKLNANTTIHHPLLTGNAYVLASAGEMTLEGTSITMGDGAELQNLAQVTITAQTAAEILIIHV